MDPDLIDEYREMSVEDMEVRAGEGDDAQQFVEGSAIIYNREVEIWPGFMEKIKPGAFEASLRGDTVVKSFFNHDPSQVLSTTRSKPKLLIDDGEKAMRFNSPITPTSYGNDLKINLERKNVSGASFAFRVDKDIVTIDEKGVMHREITEGRVSELGPVTNPAYKQTKVGLRCAEESYEECKKIVEARGESARSEEIEKNGVALDAMDQEITLLELEQ